jgi:hypothetical protein
MDYMAKIRRRTSVILTDGNLWKHEPELFVDSRK